MTVSISWLMATGPKMNNDCSLVTFDYLIFYGIYPLVIDLDQILGLYSLSGGTSYSKISWSFEATRFVFRLFESPGNLTGMHTTLNQCRRPFCYKHDRVTAQPQRLCLVCESPVISDTIQNPIHLFVKRQLPIHYIFFVNYQYPFYG